MDETPDETCNRRDPRYVETSEDLSDWIQVRFVRQFGSPIECSGLLMDLTPRAIRVALPENAEARPEKFTVGVRILVTFRFRDLSSTTAFATIGRVDTLPNGQALVLFFDIMTDEDRRHVEELCAHYHRSATSVDLETSVPSPAPTTDTGGRSE